MKENELNENVVLNYNNVFFSLFYDGFCRCIDRCTEFGLNYVASGEMVLDDGKKQVHATEGECLFVPRDLRITMFKQPANGKRYQGIFVTFRQDFLRDMFNIVGASKIKKDTPRLPDGAIKLPQTAELKSLFLSLSPYFDASTKPSDDIMRLKMQEALLALLHIDQRFAPTLFDFSKPWKIDILNFLNSHYMYDLSTEDMAHYTGRSLSTFKRDFKLLSNLTPEKWLIQKRLEVAYDLIKEGKTKIVDVYQQVGFKNPSHFSTAFKKLYGIAPSHFNA